MADISPMMQQYLDIKEQNKECILFFRLGDFYEMFYEDAKIASKELELVLTGKDCGKDERAPMCGIPYHSCEAYIARLVEKGYKIAICEQVEDPKTAKGLVKRDVVRIITPGTVIEDSMLKGSENNFIASVYYNGQSAGVSFADISTGEIYMTSFLTAKTENLLNEIGRFMPRELLLSDNLLENKELVSFVKNSVSAVITPVSVYEFEKTEIIARVKKQFGSSVSDSDLKDNLPAYKALGELLSYFEKTQKKDLTHLNRISVYGENQFMQLDIYSRRNLELGETIRGKERRGSLLWAIDKTKTAMGGRLLKNNIEQPLVDANLINKRLDAVRELFDNLILRQELGTALNSIYDMERLLTKIVYNTANPKDLRALQFTFSQLPAVKSLLAPVKSAYLREIDSLIHPLEDLNKKIDDMLLENPAVSAAEGDIIKDGYSEELDTQRSLIKNSNGILSKLEADEKEKTGIKKLKVGYNRVFGYYIEVTNSFLNMVPEHYIRKQTLTGGERYITQELKELEYQILNAKEKAVALETGFFSELRQAVFEELDKIQGTAAAIARLDVAVSFAEVSVKNNFCEPIVDNSGIIDIKDGRHPVVEKVLTDGVFVPNDTYLDMDDNRFSIITGPNMAGKSTYMRQVALIVILAQIGCFVPARSARIGIVDKIFTRIGASDDLSAGQSTFMVEMNEVANILKNATKNSLLIFDEIGRGTSTFDGMSIARAVCEYVSNKKYLGAKTLFATHYHELQILDRMDGINNYSIAVKKRGDDITFLRKIVKGGADDSYGIEVAQLAGVNKKVIERAKEVLKELESESGKPRPNAEIAAEFDNSLNDSASGGQFSLQDIRQTEIINRLKMADLNVLTPIECMNLLYELKKELEDS